jgi:DNA primase
MRGVGLSGFPSLSSSCFISSTLFEQPIDAQTLMPVSVPITWEELSSGIRANQFTVENLRQRLDFLKRDPWEGFFDSRQTLHSKR